jgi:hypothetical protein
MLSLEIRATFVPDISITCWSEELMSSLESKRGTSGIIAEGLRNAGPLSVLLGITDNWEAGERISSSGAKLYIRSSEAVDTASRNYALARAAALLTEEDFDQAKYLQVFYGKKWRKWGMSDLPSRTMLQATEAHAEIGLDARWASKPFVEQIQLLQKAYKTCLDLGIPAGSYTRSILQVACSQVAKNALAQEVGQVQGGELGQLVDLFVKRLAIRDDQVGSELDELKPAAGHAMAGGYGDDQWPDVFKKGDDIYDPQVVSNAMKKLDGEGGGSKEDPGMNTKSSKVGGGDAGSGKDKAEAVGEDTVPPLPRTKARRISLGELIEGKACNSEEQVVAQAVGRKESGDEPKSSGDKGEGERPGIGGQDKVAAGGGDIGQYGQSWQPR